MESIQSTAVDWLQRTFTIGIYGRGRWPSLEDVFTNNTFRWVDQRGETLDLLTIWPVSQDFQCAPVVSNYVETEVWPVEEPQTEARPVTRTKMLEMEENHRISKSNDLDSTAPLRLYDCENDILKDQQTYLWETNNIVPPYLVVSQVWGEIKEWMTFPTVGWPVPISSKVKWDVILAYCKRKHIKWLWMDILCIDQTENSLHADHEKATEIPKMSYYYQRATACLVIPEDCINFPIAYARLMNLSSSIAETDASVRDNVQQIWEGIASLDKVMSDQWFWRMWTYQELLLPKRLILMDGQELRVDRLMSVLTWYYAILRDGSLRRPVGGRDYDFIHPGTEMVTSRQWSPEKTGWALKKEFEQKGHLSLIAVVTHTKHKKCANYVDRLFGLYGLLSDEEKVPIETSAMSRDNPSSTAALELTWARTIRKVIASHRVWPLLHDGVDPDAAEGTNWMPRITAPDLSADRKTYYGGFGQVHPETINHCNRKAIKITDRGLHIAASIGDGGGEMNKIITCIWVLTARGFNADPIVQQLKDGLANSSIVPKSSVESFQAVLDIALHADSLLECFNIVEETDLRRKLVFAAGIYGTWNRTILALQVDGYWAPFILLSYIHITSPPKVPQCWVLDVTTESPQSVGRWMIANKVGPNIFRKIGTVRSHPIAIEELSVSVILD